MTISDRIRRAALGPTPNHPEWLYSWVGYGTGEHYALKDHADWVGDGRTKFYGSADDTERRMYLLFVAEALEE
jgi:hypothetical protein